MLMRVHILCVDDHRLFRKGVIAALKNLRDQWIFSEAENGKEALEIVAADNSICLVLLDVGMPVMDGLEACAKLKELHPQLPIIALSQFDDLALIFHLIHQGVNAYLLKNSEPELVVEAVEAVIGSGKYVTETMLNAMQAFVGFSPGNKILPDLSSRDREILNFLSHGLNTKQIASEMHLTETSIESYRKGLLQKTHTNNVAELISFAHRTGLLL
jgi:DNA-binding NarL/FixJ family response regulator